MIKPIKEFVLLFTLAAVCSFLVLASANSRHANTKYRNISPDDDTATLFDSTCAKCHGKDGHPSMRGKVAGAPTFTDAKWQSSVTDDRLINSITDGREGMPAFGKKLSADQIKALEGYVRKFSSSAQN